MVHEENVKNILINKVKEINSAKWEEFLVECYSQPIICSSQIMWKFNIHIIYDNKLQTITMLISCKQTSTN